MTCLLWVCARGFGSDSVVVFNEVMYNPGSGDDLEWVELHNQMAVDVELSQWEIDGIGYAFPTNTIIGGGKYVVVASDPAALASRYPSLNAGSILGPFTGRLANQGERLRLRNHNHRIMDELNYETNPPWPSGADGSGFSLAKRKPTAGSDYAGNWTVSSQRGGTPGSVNFSSLPDFPVVITEMPATTNTEPFWIELFNRSSATLDLNHYEVEFGNSSASTRFPEEASIEPNGYYVLKIDYRPVHGEKVFLFSDEKEQLLDAIEANARGIGRSTEPDSGFLFTSTPTPGTGNQFALERDIVISEIMYHPPTGDTNGTWIELANKGTRTIDLGEWKLKGLDYTIPSGTFIGPGEYIVFAEDAVGLRAKYPEARIVGNLGKKLSRSSALIVLEAALGNPADQVRYFDSAPWPDYADGHASLELRDLRANNERPEAWASSTTPGAWRSYSYTGVASAGSGPTRWNEFVFGLVDSGEVLLDDFSVTENPDTAPRELLRNGSFENGPTAWRFLGTHRNAQVIEDPENPANHVLRLVADGATEHMHNHVETTLLNNAAIRNGTTYKISWRARWLAGCNQLNTRLYFNRVARTTALEASSQLGTPGRPNSVAVANIGPTIHNLQHSPTVPKATDEVTISVEAEDPDGVKGCRLRWGINGLNWQTTPMDRTGNAYVAKIPPHASSTVVQFYIEAEDERGAISSYPGAGSKSRALYKVNDNQALSQRIHNFRLLMLPSEASALHAPTNVMSNGRSLCTVIYNESEIFYNCSLHLQASERGRMDPGRVGFTVSFPADHLFRGVQSTVSFDRSGGWSGRGGRQDEIIIRHIINQAGDSPDMYNDLVRVLTPQSTHTGTAQLLMAKYNGNFIDGSTYPKDGSLFKIELIYYPTTSVNNDPQLPKIPQPDDVTGADLMNLGNDQEAYRWFFLAENNRANESYGRLIELAKAFSTSGAAQQQKLAQLIDIEQWTRVFAFKCLSGDPDTYGFGLAHNQLFYIPDEGKALTFPWDLDYAWARSPTDGISLTSRAGQVINNVPAYQRLYRGSLRDIIETSFNTNYMARWVSHYGTLAGQNYSGILSYIGQRANSVRTQLKTPAIFTITTAGGRDFTTNTSTIVLQGTAPYTMKRLQMNSEAPAAGFTWPAIEKWERAISLAPGANHITITGYDFHDRVISTESIVVSFGDPSRPDQDGDGMPDDWERQFGLDPAQANGTADRDEDGLSNVAEYQAGTSPVDASSNFQLSLARAGAQQFTLSFVAQPNRAYRLQYRVGLGAPWGDLTKVPASQEGRIFTLPQTITPVAKALFYRVILDPPAL